MVGLIFSFIGIGSMKVLKSMDPAKALHYTTFVAAGGFLVAAFFVISTYGLYYRRFLGDSGRHPGRYRHRTGY